MKIVALELVGSLRYCQWSTSLMRLLSCSIENLNVILYFDIAIYCTYLLYYQWAAPVVIRIPPTTTRTSKEPTSMNLMILSFSLKLNLLEISQSSKLMDLATLSLSQNFQDLLPNWRVPSIKDIALPNSTIYRIHTFLVHTNCQKIFIIMVNGYKGNVMELVSYSFLTKALILANLSMGRLKEMADYITQMEMFILDSGKMIRLMDKANILQETELFMMATGYKIKEVAKADSNGLMVLYLMEII